MRIGKRSDLYAPTASTSQRCEVDAARSTPGSDGVLTVATPKIERIEPATAGFAVARATTAQ
jgi:hypothetical protein